MNWKGKNGSYVSIDKVRVYGLSESLDACRYPMKSDIIDTPDWDEDIRLGTKLAQSKAGSGHDCFLKGIVVQFNLKANEYFWRQLGRYHFIDHVSSQSKMHRLTSMDLDKVLDGEVDPRIKSVVKEMVMDYHILEDEISEAMDKDDHKLADDLRLAKKDLFHKIIVNTPLGVGLTSRQTTNYLQLKTIYAQRKNHRLGDWHEFCEWIECLPESQLITGGHYEG